MIDCSLKGVFAGALMCVTLISHAQGPLEGVKLSVENVKRETLVRVRVRVSNTSAKNFIVPYCGEREGGARVLCGLAVHLEVRFRDRWEPAKWSCDCSLPGGAELDKGSVVTPGQTEFFTYEFAPDKFELKRRQQVRITVDLWPNIESLKNKQHSHQFASDPFTLP